MPTALGLQWLLFSLVDHGRKGSSEVSAQTQNMKRIWCIEICVLFYTFGTKLNTRITVVIVKIPATFMPKLILMYVLSVNVTRARTTRIMLDMYTIAATNLESFKPGILTFLVWNANRMPTIWSTPR